MKKTRELSKVLTILLAVTFLFGLFPAGTVADLKTVDAARVLSNPVIVSDSSMDAKQKVTWDCVWFGSYPQSEVTGGTLYTTLKNAKGWDENNDIVINGSKYRRLKGEDAVYAISDDSGYYDWKDSYEVYHYFKYEPIKWRVLSVNGNDAFLLSDVALDNQRYNVDDKSVTWKTSSMRSWLNGYDASENQPGRDYSSKNFINAAFTTIQKNAIYTTNVVNSNNIYYGTAGGNNSFDQIFLLSESEVYNTNAATKYGFIKENDEFDEARRSHCSTYAYAMGSCRYYSEDNEDKKYNGDIGWWLRSPGSTGSSATEVYSSGWVNRVGGFVDYDSDGVRPALHLNLTSSNVYSYAGTVCSDKYKGNSNNTGNTNKDVDKNTNKNTNKNTTKKPSNPIASLKGVLKSVKSPAKSTLEIKWKKLNKVTGYQVQICLKKSFKKGTIQRKFKQKVTSTKVRPLKKKKKYYVRMRPYKKSASKTYYGKWSKVKSVKIK